MKIKKNTIAEISSWSNNCAVSAFSIFLSECIRPIQQPSKATSNKSNSKIIRRLAEMLADYYKIPELTDEAVIHLLEKYTLPSERQIVLGPALRSFIGKREQNFEKNIIPDTNMLDNDQIKYLAEEFGIGLEFYVDDKNDSDFIQLSDFVPALKPIQDNRTLRLFYSKNHFNLVCNDEFEATLFNSTLKQVSQHELPIRSDQSDQLFKIIKQDLIQFNFVSNTLKKLNNLKTINSVTLKENIKKLDAEVTNLNRQLHGNRSARKEFLRKEKKITKDNFDVLLDVEDKFIKSRLSIPKVIIESRSQNEKDISGETRIPDILNLVCKDLVDKQRTPFTYDYKTEDFDSLKENYIIQHKLARAEFRLNNEYRMLWIELKKEEELWKTQNQLKTEGIRKEIIDIKKVFRLAGDFEQTLDKNLEKLTTIEHWAINKKRNFIQTFFVKISNLFSKEAAESRAQKKQNALDDYQLKKNRLITSLNHKVSDITYILIRDELLSELKKLAPKSNEQLKQKITKFKYSIETIVNQIHQGSESALFKLENPCGLPGWNIRTANFKQAENVSRIDVASETLRLKEMIFNYLLVTSKDNIEKLVKKLNPSISLIDNLVSELKIKTGTGNYSPQYEKNFQELKKLILSSKLEKGFSKVLEKLPRELIKEFNNNDLLKFLIRENYDGIDNTLHHLNFLLDPLFEEKPLNKSSDHAFPLEAKQNDRPSRFFEMNKLPKTDPSQASEIRLTGVLSNV